jgi:arylsulfatase A-like enzyme
MAPSGILVVTTDQERDPPPYETATVNLFRRNHLTARESLRQDGFELHRRYAGSTACLPSRATLFTGQQPSVHGASQTDVIAKKNTDSDMGWPGPAGVPPVAHPDPPPLRIRPPIEEHRPDARPVVTRDRRCCRQVTTGGVR